MSPVTTPESCETLPCSVSSMPSGLILHADGTFSLCDAEAAVSVFIQTGVMDDSFERVVGDASILDDGQCCAVMSLCPTNVRLPVNVWSFALPFLGFTNLGWRGSAYGPVILLNHVDTDTSYRAVIPNHFEFIAGISEARDAGCDALHDFLDFVKDRGEIPLLSTRSRRPVRFG